MENKQKRRLLWLILLATIIWSTIMAWEVGGYRPQGCPCLPTERGILSRLASPIGALSMTRSADEFRLLIDQCDPNNNRLWNVHVAQTNTCMDFLFIALYGGAFLLFASVLGGRLAKWVRVAIVLTMLMDVGENVCLLVSMHALVYPPGSLHPSGVFSMLKWILFALSLALLAGSFAQAAGIGRLWRVVMTTALTLSGLSVLGGLFYIPLLGLAICLLGIGLLVALCLFFPIRPFSVSQLLLWIQVLYLLRFQIFGGMLLAVILPVLYFAAPSIFIGIFDSLGFYSFLFVVWAALQLAWAVMITSRMIFVYGPDRYSALRELNNTGDATVGSTEEDRLSWMAVGCFGALALPTIIMTISDTSNIHWWSKIIGLLLAVGLSLLVLWLTARLHVLIERGSAPTARQLYPQFGLVTPRKDEGRWYVGRVLDRTLNKIVPRDLKGGILTPNGRLRSGHQLATAAVAVLLGIYVAVGFIFSPSSHLHAPAALFFLLFLLSLLTWAFSGLAFFFDLLRVPVLTSSLALSLLCGSLATDHTFRGETRSDAPPSPKQVLKAWESRRGKDPTAPIVVVATAGGGIRASAWTAEVLTGIAADCQLSDGSNPFASSLLLVSSVSGGSEGTMYVLGSYNGSDGSFLDKEKLKKVRDDSAKSDLSAVGWGVLYPDLLRTIPGLGSLTGWIFGHNVDRGWALENQWVKNWEGHLWSKAPNMSDWVEDTRKGTRPAVIFNVTASETGQRMVVASSALPDGQDKLEWESTALQFAKAYPSLDIPVSTGARLSASFPWVSPMPRREGREDFLHFADGGYFDNSGLLSASDWLLAASGDIDRPVLLILVDASESERSKPRPWSWQRQFVAPIATLNSVRSGSQESRSEFELRLVSDYLGQRKVQVSKYVFTYPRDRLAPLSWHLTPEQRLSIGEAWSNASPELDAYRQELYKALKCPVAADR
jgi:hypothetical protein